MKVIIELDKKKGTKRLLWEDKSFNVSIPKDTSFAQQLNRLKNRSSEMMRSQYEKNQITLIEEAIKQNIE